MRWKGSIRLSALSMSDTPSCTAACGRGLELDAQEPLARAALRDLAGLEGERSEGAGWWILPNLHCAEGAVRAM